MGCVGLDAELLGDLGWRQPVAEVEVEQADISFAECGCRGPHQFLTVPDLIDQIGFGLTFGADRVLAATISEAAHDIVPRGP